MKNLDLECATASERIIQSISNAGKKEAQTSITKTLGILQENGIYGFYLYLRAEGQNLHAAIEQESKNLLKVVFAELDVSQPGTAVAKQVLASPERTLMAKDLLERTLVYARYHAKALGEQT